MSVSNVQTIKVTPTVDTAIYASGDRLGTLMTLSNASDASGEGVILDTVAFLDKSKNAGLVVDLLFFNDVPTIASADNAAIDITDAEMDKCIGVISTVAGDIIALAGSNYAETKAKGMILDPLAGSTSLYCLAIVRATPTFGVATDLSFYFKLRKLGV